jgi:hypothetical protein
MCCINPIASNRMPAKAKIIMLSMLNIDIIDRIMVNKINSVPVT